MTTTKAALSIVRSLPATWDGEAVEWSSLAVTGGSLDLHIPPHCDECGSTRAPWRAGGSVLSAPNRAGQRHRALRFHAARCRDCLHDVVSDENTGESWDLGPEDYGPGGSRAIEGSLW